ncbi:MAG: tyrosine-type recombinase/integrase [Pseudomonadota bacterium]
MAEVIAEMKVNLPGLCIERHRSGNICYRVRVAGDPNRKVRLQVAPDDPDFSEFYHAARRGISLAPRATAEERAVRGSVDWLIAKYVTYLEKQVDDKQASRLTLNQRRAMLHEFAAMTDQDGDSYGGCDCNIPPSIIVTVKNNLAATPGKAANMVKAIRAAWRWAMDTGLIDTNPAAAVSPPRPHHKGATPWTVEDLRKYRAVHGPESQAYLCLTLFMFTACRISDAWRLGRKNEFMLEGETWLGWQPQKRGSAPVDVPMLPPLLRATRSGTIIGETYLLTEYGRPFQSAKGLANRFKKWCLEAGLPDRSSHGIRKATGTLLAEEGCSTYEIMSIHGHTDSKTSDVYTKTINRRKLARTAMAKLRGMEW